MKDDVIRIDIGNILKDVMKQWWAILCFAVGLALLVHTFFNGIYTPKYTTRATYAIATKEYVSGSEMDITNVSETANRFSQILKSNILRNKVAEVTKMNITASIEVNVIQDTNIVEIVVTDSSPMKSYNTMLAYINNYDQVSNYAFENVIMNELQHPAIPAAPSNHSDAQKYSKYALAAGVIIGVLYVSFFSLLKDTIKNEADAKNKIDASLLGTIPHERKKRKRKTDTVVAMRINNPILSLRYVEANRMLAARIQNKMDAKNKKVVLITSVAENEGKSTVAANIAIAMAQNGAKVLLADFDFRKPSIYKILDYKKEDIKNFSDQFEKQIVIKKSKRDKIYTLLNAEPLDHMEKYFNNGYIQKIMDSLRKDYDYIVIDTPPMGNLADVEISAVISDASILVVREDMVEAKEINDAIDILNETNSKVLGIVFNDETNLFGDKIGYGRGYGNGGYYRYREGGSYGKS